MTSEMNQPNDSSSEMTLKMALRAKNVMFKNETKMTSKITLTVKKVDICHIHITYVDYITYVKFLVYLFSARL